jgi:hypothetical protein
MSRSQADVVREAIDGYKTGLAGGPMGFVSGAFDCGWTHGAQERAYAAAVHHEALEQNGNETNPASSEKTCGCTLCRDWRMRRDTLAALERLRPDQVAPRVIGADR